MRAEEQFLITASHSDGFLARHLRWELIALPGEVSLSAAWSGQRKGIVRSSPLEFQLRREDLSAFCELNDRYDIQMDDCGMQILTIETASLRKRCIAHGCKGLLKEYPELKAFYRIWDPLERVAMQLLPPECPREL